MARLAGVRGRGFICVVRWNGHFGARPLREDGEKAGDVLSDLPDILAAQITPEARLPDLARPVDQVVVCCVR